MTDPAKNWKEQLSWLTPTATVYRVQGEEVKFYPISVSTLFKLREIAAPLASAFAVLFSDKSKDAGKIERVVPEGDSVASEDVNEAIKPELAKFRADQLQQAIATLIDALTSDKNSALLAEIIMDSAQEVFADRNNRPPAKEFFAFLPAPALSGFLIGVAKANKDVLGPLASQLSGFGAELSKRLTDRLANAQVSVEAKAQQREPEMATAA